MLELETFYKYKIVITKNQGWLQSFWLEWLVWMATILLRKMREETTTTKIETIFKEGKFDFRSSEASLSWDHHVKILSKFSIGDNSFGRHTQWGYSKRCYSKLKWKTGRKNNVSTEEA